LPKTGPQVEHFRQRHFLAARLARSGIKKRGRRRLSPKLSGLTAPRHFGHAAIVQKPKITMPLPNENGAFYDGTAGSNNEKPLSEKLSNSP